MSEKNPSVNFSQHHLAAFLLTFCSYTLFHASRKSFSTVKGTMINLWTSSWHTDHPLFSNEESAEKFMGVLDCTFEFAYAIGLYMFGGLSDRFEPRLVLGIGMCLTGLTTFAFGTVTEWAHLYNPGFYLFFWVTTGLLQASGFPSEISVMGNWFGVKGRGVLFGIWASCQSGGNIFGSYLAAIILPYGYENVFLVHASFMVSFSLVILLGLVSAPRYIGMPSIISNDQTYNKEIQNQSESRPPAIGIIHALCLPGVISYCLAYACLKMVHYSIFFWLPYYLENHFGWDNALADQLSTNYDWGAIIGGIAGGLISDFLSARNAVVIAMLSCSIGALFAYSKSPKNKQINGALMGVTGIFVGGTANVISAAVSADLGSQPATQGSAEALATVSGLIDGTGSFGAAIGQILVPLVQQWLSWTAVFYMFMLLMLGAAVCLLPVVYAEIRKKKLK